ncbi:MAG TPA: L,D-transpeptidase [Nocardioides sp.]
MSAPSHRPPLRRVAAGGAAAVLAVGLLSGCESAGGGDPQAEGESAKDRPTPFRVATNVENPRSAAVDHDLRVRARSGELRTVTVTSPEGTLPGTISRGVWRATGRLEPGLTDTVTSVGERSDGRRQRRVTRIRTADLTLDEQTYASIAPLDGETVGVGMPVIVSFDLPVTDKATFERHMSVTSTAAQPGTWHWVNDHEARWRPKTYWQAGTDVHVDVDVNSLPAGNGIFGQESRSIDFHIGDSVVSKIDVDAHRMRVYVNGGLARTIPISAGKAGWETRSGTKVIIEKHRRKRMDAATIGVDKDDPEYYNLANVQYALRVTYSGEFLHAAPWSVGQQGSANVSHGCVGMSLDDAAWLYDLTRRGDVVEVTGSDRWMTLDNGYGDWNASFSDYREGSALS